jgi:O-antigen ligase
MSLHIAILGASAVALALAALAFVLDPRLGVVALGAPLGLAMIASPPVGVALLLFVLPLEELGAFSPGGLFTVQKVLGVVVLGGWLLHALVHRQPIRIPSLALPVAAFVLWGAASTLWAAEQATALSMTARYVQLLGLYLLLANVLDSPRVLRGALLAHVGGATALACLGLYLAAQGILQGGRAAIVVERELVLDSNAFAAALLLPVAVCLTGVFDRCRPSLERWGLGVAGTLCLTTMMLTQSRGALVALFTMALVVAVARRRIAFVAAVALLALPGLVLAGPELWQRMSEGLTLVDRGAGRLDIWMVGWVVIASHPLTGVGLGGFPIVYGDYLSAASGISHRHVQGVLQTWRKAPHSSYLGTTAELGVVGLTLFVVTLATHVRSVFKAWRGLEALRHPAAGLLLATLAALIAFAVFSLSFDTVHRKPFWVVLALSTLGSVRRAHVTSVAAEPARRAA